MGGFFFTPGIDSADWQDYLNAFYWESYTIYMQGMGY